MAPRIKFNNIYIIILIFLNLILLNQFKLLAQEYNTASLFDFLGLTSEDYSKDKIDDQKKLNNFKKEYKLVYIYTSTCGYCKKFSPVLKNFVNKYKIKTEALTADGKKLKYFTNAEYNIKKIDNLEVVAYPTVVAVNKNNPKDYYQLSQGYLNNQDLHYNFNYLLSKIY